MKFWTVLCLATCILFSSGCQGFNKPEQAEQPPAPLALAPSPPGGFRPHAQASPAAPSPLPIPSLEPSPTASPEPAPTVTPSQPPPPASQAPKPPIRKKDKPAAKTAQGGQKQQAAAARGSSSLTELRRKYKDSFIFQGSTAKKQIALTFDDAPDDLYTPQVLEILRKNGVKATFFVLGSQAAEHPDMVRRIAREGHVVGNHSYGHAQLKKLSQEKFIDEIVKSEQVLKPLIGYTPRLVRPPYGAVNDEELAWLVEQGYLTVNWNVDPEDWKGKAGSEILQRSLDTAGPGSIILMHSATGPGGNLQGTVDALPGLIEALRGKGYELVTLPELLQTKKAK